MTTRKPTGLFLPIFSRVVRTLSALALVSLTLMLGSAALAADVGTGTITGRVRNATNGQYIKNAQVEVASTKASTLTNQFGEFTLAEVAAGTTVLKVTYSGLDPKTVTVEVVAGKSVQKDINLGRGGGAVADDEAVKLDAFVVTAERDTNASAIATNEQQYADNIKTVVSTDAFGGVHEGNAAEFLKYLPGIAVDYIGSNANTILVRGFGSAYTGVSVDGARVATAGTGSASSATEFWVLNTNNIARVDITKEPTPDKPADSLGGSVNMVSRTAFEYSKPVFEWQAEASMNDQYPDVFKKSAGPYNQKSYKTYPGGHFNYIDPVNKNFGITVNGLVSNQFNVQRRRYAYWLGGASWVTGCTPSTPYLYYWSIQDSPSDVHRQTYSVKADWKIANKHVFGLTLQTNKYFLQYDNRAFTVGGLTPTSFSPTYTQSSYASNIANVSNAVRHFWNDADQAILTYSFTNRDWKIDAMMSKSFAKAEFQDTAKGHFNTATAYMNTGSTAAVYLGGVVDSVPTIVSFKDSSGNSIDFRDLNNYRLATAESDPVLAHATTWDSSVDVERKLSIKNIPVVLKSGASYRENTRDNNRERYLYDYVGPDGVANSSDDTAGQFLDTAYINQNNSWGWRNMRTISSYSVYDRFKDHPEYFKRRTVSDYINNAQNSEYLRQEIPAGYFRADTWLLHSRLHLIGGVRWEQTKNYGLGCKYDKMAIYQRNADGTFVHDSSGSLVRKTEAGTSGSIEEARIMYQKRGYVGNSKYSGFYPSFHANYNLTDSTILRFAFARTFGRPDLSNVVPTATVNTYDPSSNSTDYLGTVSATNVALKPWTAKCYDISAEQYFKGGGLFTVSVFRKDISNFFATLSTKLTSGLASQYGIDDDYVGYLLTTKVNAGAARVDGIEINYQQRLNFAFLPAWAKDFSLTANTTQLHMSSASNTADFSTFIKDTSNLGITYAGHRWLVMVKFNRRGKQLWTSWSGTTFAPDAHLYYAPRKYVDLNVEYQLSKRVSLFCNVRNLTDVPQKWCIAGSQTPAYAQNYWIDTFGRQIVFGLKGSF